MIEAEDKHTLSVALVKTPIRRCGQCRSVSVANTYLLVKNYQNRISYYKNNSLFNHTNLTSLTVLNNSVQLVRMFNFQIIQRAAYREPSGLHVLFIIVDC